MKEIREMKKVMINNNSSSFLLTFYSISLHSSDPTEILILHRELQHQEQIKPLRIAVEVVQSK